MITIVDYGLGNLGSIENMLRRVRVPCTVSSEPAAVAMASKLILPGVGAFDTGMENLRRLNLISPLHDAVLNRKVPILGICLGAQLMTQGSEEGLLDGLGWVQGRTTRFSGEPGREPLPVPHMGWSDVVPVNHSPLLTDLPSPARFYFVHSFHFRIDDEDNVLLRAHYGYWFTAAFALDNIIGVQFHPEKSHKYGATLLRSFGTM